MELPIWIPLNLLKFPYLVFKNILLLMGYSEIFLLSLCSFESMRLIRTISWKEMHTVKYQTWQMECSVEVQVRDFPLDEILLIFPIEEMFTWKMKNVFVLSFCGANYVCGTRSNDIHDILIIFIKNGFGSLMTDIQNHIKSLFGSHMTNYLNSANHDPKNLLFSSLSNINNSTFSSKGGFESKYLERFFTSSPNQECVEIEESVNGSFHPGSGFYNTCHLNLPKSHYLAKDVLYFFNGKSAFLSDAILSETHISNFLNNWISNEKFQNLEFFKIDLNPSFLLNPVLIKEQFLIKMFAKPRPTFHYISRKPNKSIPCHFASSFYIVRDCDGTVASVAIRRNLFIIAVWNRNEKQLADYCMK